MRGGAIILSHMISDTLTGRLNLSYFQNQVDIDKIVDNGSTTSPEARLRNIGVGYEIANDYLRIGFGTRLRWGLNNQVYDRSDAWIDPEVKMALGYKYIFFESGNGYVWGSPSTGDAAVGLRVEYPFNDSFTLRLRTGSFLDSNAEGHYLNFGIELFNFTMNAETGTFKGAQIGYTF
ncbi:MAG: hypothetical protein CMH49_02100 [Myxococcales bacterium]|nr:hypothetical protein [Myxococcales bacterium]